MLFGDASARSDWAWVRLDVTGGRIVSASGEGPGMGALLDSLPGRTLLQAAAAPGEPLATDALAAALEPAAVASPAPGRVVVAMSGGVDSAVALLRAVEAGLEPVGVTLRLWVDPASSGGDRACCSPGAALAARALCHELGVPHLTADLREEFRERVVRPFVEGYRAGATPNPCVRCNGSFRLHRLLAIADRVGARELWTGHYARLVEHRGRTLLARGIDPGKDQSYMLATVAPSVLTRLRFPLGGQTKDETRADARAAGLAAAGRPESQEACFLGGSDYRDFLRRHGVEAREGELVDPEGRVLGRHDGFWTFTPGQRRGLRVASSEGALYTVATDPDTNTVVVGPRRLLARTRIAVDGGRLYVPVDRIAAKLRYRSPTVPATVTASERGFTIDLDEPAFGVARGQAAVLYEGDVVVGAGLVSGSG